MTEKRYIDKIATNITNEAAKIEMEEQLLQHRLSDIGILRQQVEEERKTERQRKRQEDEEVERFLAKSAIVQSSQRDRFGKSVIHIIVLITCSKRSDYKYPESTLIWLS